MKLEGTTLDIYDVAEELGRGGMGAVYRAVSTADGLAGPAGSKVAIKALHGELVSDERNFARFVREAEIGQALDHPNVVRTYAAGRADVDGETCHYMVLEYVEGQTLDDLRAELGVVPDHLLYLVGDQALAGLQAIHEHGVIHRDIKPENIVITTSHKVLIMDLGVARLALRGHTLTETGEFVGSLHYAAPEQLDSGAEIQAACDIYSFGVVLFELATGQRAFDAPDIVTLFSQKLSGEKRRPRDLQADIDPFWDEVIGTCLEREPGNRFASAEEMRAILTEGRQSVWWQTRSTTREPSAAERALKRLQLNREVGLIGREPEFAALSTSYGRASADGGRVAFLRGASGVGKSRLLYEFLEELAATGGPRVAAGRAVGQGGRAYQPFVDVAHDLLDIDDDAAIDRRGELEQRLAELLPDRPGVVGPLARFILADLAEGATPLSPDALLAAFDALLHRAAEERPLVVVLEDLHLAGDDTLELLAFLVRNLGDARLLLVGVLDHEQVEEGSRLHKLLAEIEGRDNVDAVSVEHLSREECDVLVREVVVHQPTVHALGDLLYRRSEGNPLLILEVIAQLKATGALAPEDGGFVLTREVGLFEVPSKVTQLIHFKLANLDEEQRETLETAAILGHEFQASVLAKMLEERRIKLLKRLALLERKYRVLRSSGKDSFRFATRQIAEVLYQGISPDLRTEYHSLAADTLLEDAEDEAPAPAIAFQVVRHLIAGERGDEVAPLAATASAHAVGNYHATYVAAFLERVANAIRDAEPAIRFDVCLRRWDCYGALGRRQDQVAVLEEAYALAQEADDAGRQAQVFCLQGVTDWRTGDYEAAHAKAEQALELARSSGSRQWEANALHTLGAVVRHWGEFASCATYWREALAIRQEIGDRHGEARSLASLGTVMPDLGEEEGALAAKEQALAIFRELGDLRGECALLNNIGNTLVDHRRIEDATERFQEAIRIAQRLGSLIAEGHPNVNLGRAYALLGYEMAARECLDRALTIFRQARAQSGVVDALRELARTALAFGRLEEARETWGELLALVEAAGAKPAQLEVERQLGTVWAEEGDEAAAGACFERALALADQLESPRLKATVLQAQGTAALFSATKPERALPIFVEACAIAEASGQAPLGRALLAAYRVWALWLLGEREEASSLARRLAEVVGEGEGLPTQDGPDICFVLGTVLGEEGGAYLERARELVRARAEEIQDPVHRDRYLTLGWPARELGTSAEAER